MTGSLLRLNELRSALTPSERRIAEFFDTHSEHLIDIPILDVAEACQTSKSTVVRLCKRIGYKGYKDFLNAVSADIAVQSMKSNINSDILPGSSIDEICHIVTANSIRALENTLRLLDMSAMENAVSLLCSARRIDFYGVGSSGIIAQDAALKFKRIGANTFSSLDPHCQIISAATLGSDDAAVILSYYGETRDIIETMRAARNSGAAVISITKYGENTISSESDIVLQVASAETLTRSGAMSSRMVMLQVVDILFTAVTGRKYDEVCTVLNRTAAAVKSKRL